MFYIYIIRSISHQKLYIGQTQDLDSRVQFHNSGRSKYTKPYMPWRLTAYKPCVSRSEAVILERKIKNLKSKEIIFSFIDKNAFVLVNSDE